MWKKCVSLICLISLAHQTCLAPDVLRSFGFVPLNSTNGTIITNSSVCSLFYPTVGACVDVDQVSKKLMSDQLDLKKSLNILSRFNEAFNVLTFAAKNLLGNSTIPMFKTVKVKANVNDNKFKNFNFTLNKTNKQIFKANMTLNESIDDPGHPMNGLFKFLGINKTEFLNNAISANSSSSDGKPFSNLGKFVNFVKNSSNVFQDAQSNFGETRGNPFSSANAAATINSVAKMNFGQTIKGMKDFFNNSTNPLPPNGVGKGIGFKGKSDKEIMDKASDFFEDLKKTLGVKVGPVIVKNSSIPIDFGAIFNNTLGSAVNTSMMNDVANFFNNMTKEIKDSFGLNNTLNATLSDVAKAFNTSIFGTGKIVTQEISNINLEDEKESILVRSYQTASSNTTTTSQSVSVNATVDQSQNNTVITALGILKKRANAAYQACFQTLVEIQMGSTCLFSSSLGSSFVRQSGSQFIIAADLDEVGSKVDQNCLPVFDAICVLTTGQSLTGLYQGLPPMGTFTNSEFSNSCLEIAQYADCNDDICTQKRQQALVEAFVRPYNYDIVPNATVVAQLNTTVATIGLDVTKAPVGDRRLQGYSEVYVQPVPQGAKLATAGENSGVEVTSASSVYVACATIISLFFALI